MILTPRMRSSVGLPGLAILVAPLLTGSALAGIVGALVSVPTAALVAVLVDEYLVRAIKRRITRHEVWTLPL